MTQPDRTLPTSDSSDTQLNRLRLTVVLVKKTGSGLRRSHRAGRVGGTIYLGMHGHEFIALSIALRFATILAVIVRGNRFLE